LFAIVIGILWITYREVLVGLEDRPPWFVARGRWAKALGVGAIALGIFVVFY
jgi:hypothetical protein